MVNRLNNFGYFRSGLTVRLLAGVLLSVVFVATPIFCMAQKNVIHSNEQWMQYYNNYQLPGKLHLHTDIGLRTRDAFDKAALASFRTGIGYPLRANLRAITGMALFESYQESKPSRIEFRSYQDMIGVQKFTKISLHHRFRVEARRFWQHPGGQTQASSDFNFRFRYRLVCSIPLGFPPPGGKAARLSFNIGDEIMVNAGKSGKHNILNANRILLGPAFRFNENFSLSLTYNYQFGQRGVAREYHETDVVWIGLTHDIKRK